MLPMKNIFLVFTISLAFFTHIHAQENKKSAYLSQQVLDHHNKVRKAIGAPPLAMSNSLSAYAQQWAEHLASKGSNIFHSECMHPDGRRLGENIFWGSSYSDFTPLDASLSWYEEIGKYKYGPVIGGSKGTGHYTQMVWKDTREMGLGVAQTKQGGIIVVASYYPAGNVVGSYPY